MYIWRLARPYFSFLLSASLLSLSSQKMNRRLKYTGGDIRLTRGLTVLWGLSSVRVTGRRRGKSVLENEMVVFVLRAGPMNTWMILWGAWCWVQRKAAVQGTNICVSERMTSGCRGVNRPNCLSRRHRFTLRFVSQAVSLSWAVNQLFTADARVRTWSPSTANLWCTVQPGAGYSAGAKDFRYYSSATFTSISLQSSRCSRLTASFNEHQRTGHFTLINRSVRLK
jgi:hypothetical protein